MKKDLKFWALCVAHNCIAHPLLPVAEAAESAGVPKLAQLIYKLHDKTLYGEE